jgi:hypothetical protein
MSTDMQLSPISVRCVDRLLFETYRQAGSIAAPPNAHAHEEVQIGLNVNAGGRYRYRTGVHPIGVGEVVFVAGGESHRPGDGRAAAEGGEYRTLYVPSSDWRRALRDAGLGEVSPLDPVIGDPVLAAELLRLHRRADSGAVPDLDWDILVDGTLARLAAHLGGAPKKRPAAGGRRLERARAYLHANADRGFGWNTWPRWRG